MLSGWAGFAIVYYSPPHRRPSEPSPGWRFPRSPLAEVGHRRPFFRRHVVVPLCGWDMAAPRGRRRPSGARESALFWGGCFNQDIFKDPKKRHDHLSVLYIKDSNKDICQVSFEEASSSSTEVHPIRFVRTTLLNHIECSKLSSARLSYSSAPRSAAHCGCIRSTIQVPGVGWLRVYTQHYKNAGFWKG